MQFTLGHFYKFTRGVGLQWPEMEPELQNPVERHCENGPFSDAEENRVLYAALDSFR